MLTNFCSFLRFMFIRLEVIDLGYFCVGNFFGICTTIFKSEVVSEVPVFLLWCLLWFFFSPFTWGTVLLLRGFLSITISLVSGLLCTLFLQHPFITRMVLIISFHIAYSGSEKYRITILDREHSWAWRRVSDLDYSFLTWIFFSLCFADEAYQS